LSYIALVFTALKERINQLGQINSDSGHGWWRVGSAKTRRTIEAFTMEDGGEVVFKIILILSSQSMKHVPYHPLKVSSSHPLNPIPNTIYQNQFS
jgi:hypothetical protein